MEAIQVVIYGNNNDFHFESKEMKDRCKEAHAKRVAIILPKVPMVKTNSIQILPKILEIILYFIFNEKKKSKKMLYSI